MRIAHFAPFAPHRCGMYETVRDMMKAATFNGHEVALVDTGANGNRHVGDTDERPGFSVVARDYPDVRDFDLFVLSSSIPRAFTDSTTAPVLHVMHGRPLSSFRLSQTDPKAPVYDVYAEASRNKRNRIFLSLWPEHLTYWRVLIPASKLRATPNPPVDLDSFTPTGPKHEFSATDNGKLNVLVADLWRPDTDPYHAAHALIEAGRCIVGMKVHFYGCSTKPGPWQHIFAHMRRMGILGEVRGMMLDIADVYRACDLLVTPHSIATRIVRESLACGTPIVAGHPSKYTPFRCDMSDAQQAAATICRAATAISGSPEASRRSARESAARFGLPQFSKSLELAYQEAVA